MGKSGNSEALRKHNQVNRYAAYQQACANDEHYLEEIWVYKIMTNIDAHWDYVKNCPKQRSQQQQLSANRSMTQTNKSMLVSKSTAGTSMVSNQQRRRSTFLSCFSCSGKASGTSSPAVMKLERKKLQDTHMGAQSSTQYTSPSKIFRQSLVETQQRV